MIVIRALDRTDVHIDESAVVILGDLHQAVNEDLARHPQNGGAGGGLQPKRLVRTANNTFRGWRTYAQAKAGTKSRDAL